MAAELPFDAAKWDKLIQKPDWYMGELWDELTRLIEQQDPEALKRNKAAVRNYFADRLWNGKVAIATGKEPTCIDLDTERKPIDTVVIHHTSNSQHQPLKLINAVQLLQIYVPYFRSNIIGREAPLRGAPLWSGHFFEGRQVFWGYHAIVWRDSVETQRILPNEAIGWHAGNWEVNTRSVGVCFDDDFEQKDPSPEALAACAELVYREWPQVKPSHIITHRAAREAVGSTTMCPGKNSDKWMDELRSLVGKMSKRIA